MNDKRVNGKCPDLGSTSFSTVADLFELAQQMPIDIAVGDSELFDVPMLVDSQAVTYTEAIVLWLSYLFMQSSAISLKEFTNAMRTADNAHPQVQVALYETVYGAQYNHRVEEEV